MKFKRKWIVILTVILLFSTSRLVQAEENTSSPVSTDTTKLSGVIALNETEGESYRNISIRVSQTYQLKITDSSKTAKWTSSNKKVVTVDSKGKIKGIKIGTATITAKVAGQVYTAKVSVVAALNGEDFGYKSWGAYYSEDDATKVVGYVLYDSDFMLASFDKKGYFESSDSVDCNKEGICCTSRGIANGDTLSDVKKDYGYTKLVAYSDDDLIHKYVAKNHPEVDVKSRWINYLEYTYIDKSKSKYMAGEYRIRFYIDSNNLVTEIMFIKDLPKVADTTKPVISSVNN